VDRFSAAQKMMKQVRNGGMPAGLPPGMAMPAMPKVNAPVNKKKKSKSGNPAKRAQEEG
jgi:signal recognition particle subunit SRP54